MTLVSNNSDVALTRRNIAADLIVHNLRLVSFNEKRGPMTTTFEVVVAGHPRRIREYRDARRDENAAAWSGGGGVGDLVLELLFGFFVAPAYRALKRRWQGRNDPPIEQGGFIGLDGVRAIVSWTRVSEDISGEALGTVTIESYTHGQVTSGTPQAWADPVRRSVAQAYAAEHDYVLIVDD